MIYTGVQEVNQGNPMIDVIQLVKELRGKRKHMIAEKEQLKFCFNTILYHCQDILMKSKYCLRSTIGNLSITVTIFPKVKIVGYL